MSSNIQCQQDTNTKLLKKDPIPPDSAWSQLPDEPPEAYDVFLKYLSLGPRRTLLEAWRKARIASGHLLPGQPPGELPAHINAWSAKYAWRQRCHAWDKERWHEEVAMIEEARTSALHEMITRHIEGWQVISEAAIGAFFERDEDGNLIRDEHGKPVIRIIDDASTALRAYRQAVAGERTARGLPAELVVMSTEDIKQRIVDINQRLNALQSDDEDTIDAEYEEIND